MNSNLNAPKYEILGEIKFWCTTTVPQSSCWEHENEQKGVSKKTKNTRREYYVPNTALSPPQLFCIKTGSDESPFNVS